MKKTLSVLLCLVILLGVFPLNGLAELDFSRLSLPDVSSLFSSKVFADGENGTYGGDVGNTSWSYDSGTRTLYISGTGAMADISEAINDIKSSVKYIEISEGITSIADYVFNGLNSLKNVNIPDSMESIGTGAFRDCRFIQSFHLPRNIHHIGAEAFYCCVNLRNINIPQSVTEIPERMLGGCTYLTDVIIPEEVTVIGFDAFSGVTPVVYYTGDEEAWSEIEILGGNESLFTDPSCICTESVYADPYSEEVSILDYDITVYQDPVMFGVESDAHNLIRINGINCTCSEVVIPDIIDGYLVAYIEEEAFKNSSISSVRIPQGIKRIGEKAFYGCVNLSEINFNAAYCGGIDYRSDLFGYAGENTSGVRAVFGESVRRIPSYLFCSLDHSVVYERLYDDYLDRLGYFSSLFSSKKQAAVQAFSQECASNIGFRLTSVSIGRNVRYIGDRAFFGCEHLEDIEYNARSASVIQQQESPSEYNPYTADDMRLYELFGNSSALNNVYNGIVSEFNSYLDSELAEDSPFAGCGKDGLTLTIGSDVEELPEYMFRNIRATVLNYNAEEITSSFENVFAGASIETVYFGSGVIYVPDNLFKVTDETDLPQINNISFVYGIENTLEGIGQNAFFGLRKIDETGEGNVITITASISMVAKIYSGEISIEQGNDIIYQITVFDEDSIFDYYIKNRKVYITGFSNSAEISQGYDLVIPEQISGFDVVSALFYEEKRISSVTIPSSVNSFSFNSCINLEQVTFSDGFNADTLQNGSFVRCDSLWAISIPDCITQIDDGAFVDCPLKYVEMGSGLNYIPEELIKQDYLKTFVIGDGVSEIRGQFAGCSFLSSIFIPAGVTDIQPGSFANSGLIDISVDENNPVYYSESGCIIEKITKEIVQGCNSSVIPDDIVSIGDYAFKGFNGINGITVPYTVESIGKGAFSECGVAYLHRFVCTQNGYYPFQQYVAPLNYNLNISEIRYERRKIFFYYDEIIIKGTSEPNNCGGNIVIPEKLQFNNGVSYPVCYIDSGAFAGCSGITGITIPSKIKNIGNKAFSGCYNVDTIFYNAEKMVLNSSVLFNAFFSGSGPSVFADCGRNFGTDLVFGDTVEKIPQIMFYCWENVKSIYLGKNVIDSDTAFAFPLPCLSKIEVSQDNPNYYIYENCLISVGKKILFNQTGDKVVKGCAASVIPDNGRITEIGESAFYLCSGLSGIELPDGLTKIGSYAFSGCSGLSGIELPDSLTTIGSYAFSGCTGLSQIAAPDSIREIGKNAFYNTAYYNNPDNWENGILYLDNYLINAKTDITGFYDVKDGTICIAESAFSNCRNLVNLNVPAEVRFIGYNAFYDVFNVSYSGSASGSPWGARGINARIVKYNGRDKDGNKQPYYLLFQDGNEKSILIACLSCGACEISIPSSVGEIRKGAFRNCSNIEKVKVFVNTKAPTFGEDSFSGCTRLKEIEYIAEILIDSNVIIEDDGTRLLFCNRAKSGTYTIPGSVLFLDDNAFAGCNNLTVDFSECNILSAGENALFSTLNNLTEITDENGNYILTFCEGILIDAKEITKTEDDSDESGENPDEETPENPEEEPVDTTGWCTLPDNTTCIAACAFADCENLRKIILNKNLKGISRDAFQNCKNLEEIDDSETSLLYVGKNAFYENSPFFETDDENESIYVGNALIKAAGSAIRSGTTCIADGAFENNAEITSVSVPGSVFMIGNEAFDNCSGLMSLTIGNGVRHIGNRAFENCTSLQRADIPESVERIGYCAFLGCTGVTGYNADVNNDVFSSDKGVMFKKDGDTHSLFLYPSGCEDTEYCLPEGVSYIDDFAFAYCSNLNEITMHGTVNYKTLAFYKCPARRQSDKVVGGIELSSDGRTLTQVLPYAIDENGRFTVPDSVRSIQAGAFTGDSASRITVIDFNKTEIICDSALSNLSNLESVENSSNIRHIGSDAFKDCGELDGIDLSGSEYIGNGAFSGCAKLNGDNVTLPERAYVAGNAFDFEVSVIPLHEIKITAPLEVKYGEEMTVTAETADDNITWIDADTGETFDSEDENVTINGNELRIRNVTRDYNLIACVINENNNQVIGESEICSVMVTEVIVEISDENGNRIDRKEASYSDKIELEVPADFKDYEIKWYKTTGEEVLSDGVAADDGSVIYSFIATEDMTIYFIAAPEDNSARTYRSNDVEIKVNYPESISGEISDSSIPDFDNGKTVILSLDNLPDGFTDYYDIVWYKDGTEQKRGKDNTLTVENATESFKIKVEFINKKTGKEVYGKDFNITVKDKVVVTPDISIKINNMAKYNGKTLDYKTTIEFSSTSENRPEGSTVHWYINGNDSGTGDSFTVKTATAGFTVQSKLIGSDGSVLAESERETVNINTGFFAKLIAFFRGLFGKLPVVKQ